MKRDVNLIDESPLERSPTYQSLAMSERRRKILRTARRLIATNGIDNFGLRELCKEAGVALKTLYNTFYSKDRLIAVAIREVYVEIEEKADYLNPATTIEGIIERLIAVNQRNFKARNYTLAVTSLYFGINTPKVVWETLQALSFRNLKQWVIHTKEIGEFYDWVDADDLAHDIVNLEFSVINDWATKRISDKQYLPRLVLAVLSHAAGVTRGATLESVNRLIQQIYETGELPVFSEGDFDEQEIPSDIAV